MPTLTLVAACALIDKDGRILLSERPADKEMSGMWEFPGGKIEPGETAEGAVIRELREELDLDIEKSCLAPLFFASHKLADSHLLMPLFICRRWNGSPRPLEGQRISWVTPSRLRDYQILPASRPLISMLRDWL